MEQLKHAIECAEAVVIGAGAGLSTAAGFTYTGSAFTAIFRILSTSTDFGICILAVSIRSQC